MRTGNRLFIINVQVQMMRDVHNCVRLRSCPFSFCRHVRLSRSRPRPRLFLQQQVHAAGCGGKQQVPVHGSGGQHWVQRQRMPCGKAAQCRLCQKANQGQRLPHRSAGAVRDVALHHPVRHRWWQQRRHIRRGSPHNCVRKWQASHPTHCCAAQRSARATQRQHHLGLGGL